MLLFVAWDSDVSDAAQRATFHDEPSDVARLAQAIEAGNRQWESWLLTVGGQLIAYVGNEGQAKVPADRLGELPEIMARYKSAVNEPVSIGVGTKLHEAVIALKAAHLRGGNKIVLYTDQVSEEVANADEDSDILGDKGSLDKFEKAGSFDASTPSPGLASKVASGAEDPSAAMPSPPSSPSPFSPSPPPSAGQQGPAPATGGSDVGKLKQSVVAVLQEAKAAQPALEKMKEANPEAYALINDAIGAMIEMAKRLFPQPQQGGQQPVTKAEESASERAGVTEGDVDPEELATGAKEEAHEHGVSEEEAKRIALDHLSEDPHYYSKKAMEKASSDPNHIPVHHLNLPVGSSKDGKVKVTHSDGSTSWVSVRAGQILSEDAHPISSRNPEGR